VTETEDLQLSRVMMQLGHKNTDLDRYIYLINLLGHNETVFYRTVMSDPARFLTIVYDPTIGEACVKFGHIYRQVRGMYLSMTRRGKIKEILRNWPQKMPTGPPSREQDPQEPVGALEAQAQRRVLLENRELVTKREDLRLQGGTGSKTGGDKSEKGDEKRAHRDRTRIS